LSLKRTQTGATCFHTIELHGRIDFRQRVTRGNNIAYFNVQNLKLSRNLRANVNKRTWLQEASRGYRIFDITTLDGSEQRPALGGGIAAKPPVPDHPQQSDERQRPDWTSPNRCD
jgi:hypothetical protein